MSDIVFKILAPSETFHAVNYNDKKEKKGTAQMVHFENFGMLNFKTTLPDKKEIVDYLEDFGKMNTRTKHKQFHAIMSCKGNTLSHEELKDKALQVMEQLGYKDQPILVYAHRDTNNNHIHIVTTRINKDGKKINDSYEKKRVADILIRLQGRDVNKELQQDLQKCFGYKFSTEAQFRLLMEKQGYKITVTEEKISFIKYGAVQGELPKTAISDKCQKEIDTSRIRQVKAIITKYQQRYDTTLQAALPYIDKPVLQSELSNFLRKQLGIECVFFTTKEGKAHGYTIIDHANKNIFKGSDVMKLSELLTPTANGTSIEILKEQQQPNNKLSDEDNSLTFIKQPLADTDKEEQQSDTTLNIGEELSIIIHESEKQSQSGVSGYERKPAHKKRRFF